MQMEQIVKLLFAATLVSIFAYVLIFTSIGGAGNGGEYWGYDGSIEPHVAAAQSFDSGDYRYLEVDLAEQLGKRVHQVPMYYGCRDHPLGTQNNSKQMVREALHGADSTRLATEFALRFNNRMNSLMVLELDICCGDCKSQ
jgi:hypothetical protein